MTAPGKQHHGFSMMELLVAMAVTLVLLMLVNQIFIRTTRAVSLGVRTGNLMTESEVIRDQLDRDRDHIDRPAGMLGPREPDDEDTPAGFLMIANFRFDDVQFPVELGPQGLSETDANQIRNDYGQGFVNRTDELQPIRSDQLAFFTRAPSDRWYRPVTPKNEGAYPNDLEARYARVWYGHVLQNNIPYDPQIGPPFDELKDYDEDDFTYDDLLDVEGTRWTLGRQRLMLIDGLREEDEGRFDDSQDFHAFSANWGDQTQTPDNLPLSFGLTDVADERLVDIFDDPNTGLSEYPHDDPNYFLDANAIGEPPHPPLFTPQPPTSTLSAYNLARTHMQLAAGVSDFIVEFAGDYDDAFLGLSRNGHINRFDGEIVWYTAAMYANIPGEPDYDPSQPITYPAHPDDIAGLDDYNNAAANTEFYYDDSNNVGRFLWRHDTPEAWPHLIRVRYRMHDGRGQLRSTAFLVDEDGNDVQDQTAPVIGRWFEHVIRVPRP